MKTKLFFIIVQIMLFSTCFSQGTWTEEPYLPSGIGRKGDLSFSIGSLGFIGLGYDKSLWCFNTTAKTWILKTTFPGTFRSGGFGFCIAEEIFYGGGAGKNDLWLYEPNLNQWTQFDSLPFSASNGTGFSIGNKGYLVSEKEVWEYDPLENNWVQKKDFPGSARHFSTAITINNKEYLAFGSDGTYGGLPDLWEYDPQNDSWIKKSDCPVPRLSAYGFSLNNKGYFGGGYREWYGSDLSDFYEYDPLNDNWTGRTSPGGTYGAIAFSTNNGHGYYGFGTITCHSCQPLNFLKEYTPEITAINIQEKDQIDFQIFPNPTNNSVTINFHSSIKDELQIKIMNELGQTIYMINEKYFAGELIRTIDLEDQPKGIYIIEVDLKNMRRTQKISLE